LQKTETTNKADRAAKVRPYKTRVQDGPIEMFDGALVNRARMAEIMRCPPDRILRYIQEGMPHIKRAGRYWLEPPAALEWFKSGSTQKNQGRHAKSEPKTKHR
jgi:hypothetical protein